MPNPEGTAAALAVGRANADAVLALRKEARARRAAVLASRPGAALDLTIQPARAGALAPAVTRQTMGFLAAAGDSWFDYPLHDVLKSLEDDHGYNVESAAHRGARLESMAYEKEGQLEKLARGLEKIAAQGAKPKAVLLSGGGDDIAGPEFGMLLNEATSAIGGWNNSMLDGLLNQRIRTAFQSMFGAITYLCQQDVGQTLPILVHGYDYPVPDGRGFLGGWPFPGPWLQPGFREKLFNDLQANVNLMHDLIDRFNVMLSDLARLPEFQNVRYVDLRNTLPTDVADYQQWWSNELHPTGQGFSKIAAKFAVVLDPL